MSRGWRGGEPILIGKPVAGSAACALLGLLAFPPVITASQPLTLDKQLVTATRTAQTAEQSLAAVTLIDRAQIERSQAPVRHDWCQAARSGDEERVCIARVTARHC